MVLTYNNYISQMMAFEEQIKENRLEEGRKVEELNEERNLVNRQIFDEMVDKKRANNVMYGGKIIRVRNDFKKKRHEIYEQSSLLTSEWRAQLLKLEKGEITREEIYGEGPQYKEGGEV